MDNDGFGRYRPLIRALVQHSNTTSRHAGIKKEYVPGIRLSAQEWQVLEYLIEHEDEDENMLYISERLGLAQSSLSKYTKTLCREELVARFHIKGNRKNVILKATDKGWELYRFRCQHVNRGLFAPLMDALDTLPDETILQVSAAIEKLNLSLLHGYEPTELIPVEEQP